MYSSSLKFSQQPFCPKQQAYQSKCNGTPHNSISYMILKSYNVGASIQPSAINNLARNRVKTNAVASKWWTKNKEPNMFDITSPQQLQDIVVNAENKLVIVDFYATWCSACRALYPKLSKICKQNPDIILCKVNWKENKETAKALGVKVLPYFIMFRGGDGLVAQFSASVSKIQRLKDALERHTSDRCPLEPPRPVPQLEQAIIEMEEAASNQDNGSDEGFESALQSNENGAVPDVAVS